MRLIIFMFVLMVALVVLPPVLAQDIGVGLYVLNLGRFDISTGAFTADFYLSLKCPKACSPDGFEFLNGRAMSVDKIIDKPSEKFYRIQANLNSPVDLRMFPFDRQKIEIILEDRNRTVGQLNYVPITAESGIDTSITFTGWNIDGWDTAFREHYYPIYNETYSQYVFTVLISRIALTSFLKTFLPVFFIVIVVLFSFIIDPDKIATRITMTTSSLVAAVMFHVSIANQLPPIGYLTFADKFMMLTYFVLMVSLIITIVVLELVEQKKRVLAEKVHRATEYTMFVAVPLLYLLLFIFFI